MISKWIAGLRSANSTPHECEREAGMLVPPVRFDPELYEIGARWECLARRGESTADHRWRLQVHLTSLQIALEEDLAVVLQEKKRQQ